MPEKTNIPKQKARITNGEGKDTFISLRVSREMKADLKAKADACGMYLSDYILSLCYGYEPKAVMTAKQEKLLEPLIGIRADMKNFNNALKGTNAATRKFLFGDEKFMYRWKTDIDMKRAAVTDIINSFTKPNT